MNIKMIVTDLDGNLLRVIKQSAITPPMYSTVFVIAEY
jgi:hypothetical protein